MAPQLVEMEVRELLDFYKFDGDETPVIQVRALLPTPPNRMDSTRMAIKAG